MKLVLRSISASFDPNIWRRHTACLEVTIARVLFVGFVLTAILLGRGTAYAESPKLVKRQVAVQVSSRPLAQSRADPPPPAMSY